MTAAVAYAARSRLSFRAVNRVGSIDYDPALQRHHLLPRQLLRQAGFARLFAAIDARRLGYDDFRRNGVLLPARSEAAERLALPLHRGPHRAYNAMVGERVGQIEASWQARRRDAPVSAGEEALFRLALLQRALRRQLIRPAGRRLVLNRHDPLGTGVDFAELDAMVERLWGGTQTVFEASSAFAD